MRSNSTRPAMIGTMAAPATAATTSIAAAAAAPADIDPHLAWQAEIERLDSLPADDDQEFDRICHVIFRVQDLIAETPARTLAGIRVRERDPVARPAGGASLSADATRPRSATPGGGVTSEGASSYIRLSN